MVGAVDCDLRGCDLALVVRFEAEGSLSWLSKRLCAKLADELQPFLRENKIPRVRGGVSRGMIFCHLLVRGGCRHTLTVSGALAISNSGGNLLHRRLYCTYASASMPQ